MIFLRFIAFLFLLADFSYGSCEYFISTSSKNTKYDSLDRDNFKKIDPNELKFGHSNLKYWVKIKCENRTHRSVIKLMEIKYSTLDSIKIYNNLGEVTEVFGDTKVNKSSINYRRPVFKIYIEKNSINFVLLEIDTKGSYSFPIVERTIGTLLDVSNKFYLFIGITICLFILIIITTLALGIKTRDPVYFFYLSNIVVQSFWVLSNFGITQQYIFIDLFGVWESSLFSNIMPILVLISTLLFVEFSRRYLKLREHSKKINKIVSINILLLIPLIVISILFFEYPTLNKLGVIFSATGSIMVLIFVVIAKLNRQKLYFYSYGISIFVVLVIVSGLLDQGLLPRNIFTENSSFIGMILESILLLLSLVFRFKEEHYDRLVKIDNEKKIIDTILATTKIFVHDLKSPLKQELASLESIKSKNFQNDASEEIDNLIEKTKQRYRFVQSVLDLDSGEESSICCVHNLIVQALEISQTDEKYIVVNISVDLKIEVFVPKNLFLRSMKNIVDNAVEADCKKIDINGVVKGNILELNIISDTKVSKKARSSLFNPFFTSKPMGSGLGLSVVKNFTESIGASINVKYTSRTTNFQFMIPVSIDILGEKINRKIVLIDDDPFGVFINNDNNRFLHFYSVDEFLDYLDENADILKEVEHVLIDRYINGIDTLNINFLDICKEIGYLGDVSLVSDSINKIDRNPTNGFKFHLPKYYIEDNKFNDKKSPF